VIEVALTSMVAVKVEECASTVNITRPVSIVNVVSLGTTDRLGLHLPPAVNLVDVIRAQRLGSVMRQRDNASVRQDLLGQTAIDAVQAIIVTLSAVDVNVTKMALRTVTVINQMVDAMVVPVNQTSLDHSVIDVLLDFMDFLLVLDANAKVKEQ